MGQVQCDFKLLSRDHKKSVMVEGAIVDPRLAHTVVPMHWLEQLRSPSTRLPQGYFKEESVAVKAPNDVGLAGPLSSLKPYSVQADAGAKPNAIRAGPLVMYITGQMQPVVVYPDFVAEDKWPGMISSDNCDIRIGMDAITQCGLYSELLPGGLLSDKGISELKRQGMVCGLAESPLVSRPHLRMKNFFIEELTRGPAHKEFIGYNPRVGTPWRFSQHCKYFRTGIWKEITRKNEMHPGLHHHSSWQKSPQQSVPEVRFMAPSP